MLCPTKSGQFQIEDSFNLVSRGLVILGQLTHGRVKVGDYLRFKYNGETLTTTIQGVEMADNISTKEYKVGLIIGYIDNFQKRQFDKEKIMKGIAQIVSDK